MYFGDLANFKVFGNLKVVEVLTFNDLEELVPFKAAFLAAWALTVAILNSKKDDNKYREKREINKC